MNFILATFGSILCLTPLFFFLHVTRATDRHLPLKSMCSLFCISCLSADLSSVL
jgi:hypothetical protein